MWKMEKALSSNASGTKPAAALAVRFDSYSCYVASIIFDYRKMEVGI